MEVNEKKLEKQCPICGKVVRARGFVSHVRLAHSTDETKFEREEKKKMYELIDELQEVKRRMKKVEEEGRGFLGGWYDEDLKEVWKALELRRRELIEKIKELQQKMSEDKDKGGGGKREGGILPKKEDRLLPWW